MHHWPNDTTEADRKRKVDLELMDFPFTSHRRSIPTTDLTDANAMKEAQEIRNFGFHSIFNANWNSTSTTTTTTSSGAKRKE